MADDNDTRREMTDAEFQEFLGRVKTELQAELDAENAARTDRLARTWPLDPDDYNEPFRELIDTAGKTQAFREGDPQLLRQTVSNLRGLKGRAIEAIGALSNEMYEDWNHHREGDRLGTVLAMTLLSEMAADLEREERGIIDRIIDGDGRQDGEQQEAAA